MAKTHNTTTAPTGQIAPFGLRMLPELREKVEAAARESGRSMNAEIVARLESSFVGQPSVIVESFVREMAFVRHTYERQINSLTFGQELLAQFLLASADFLPDEVVHAKQFAAALSLAKGVLEKDADELVAAYAGLFPELSGAPVLDELRKMSEEHKRGEDVTHYMRQHLDNTRTEWEKDQLALGREAEAPRVTQENSKDPTRSSNVPKPPPKKK